MSQLAGLLSDEGFTQQLLQGLPGGGVDPQHESVREALALLRCKGGRSYTPVDAAVHVVMPGGVVSRVMSQAEAEHVWAERDVLVLLDRWREA